jgi:hypothetical protein
MAFPIGPTNGQITTVNGIKYIYRSATNSWARLGSAKFTAAASAPSNAAQGDRWYNTGLDILFEFINDGTTNYWVDIQSVGQTGNVTSISDSVLNGNIVVGVNNRYSVGTSVGYLQNIYANNITANSTVSNTIVANSVVSNSIVTTTAVRWSGNGNPITGTPYTVSATPPSGPSLGDQWYNTNNDILYEYISDGTSSYWVDIQSPTLSGNTSLAALVVTGGADISGNVNIGANLVVNSYSNVFIATGSLTNRSALTISGNVYGRGGIGYLDAVQLTNSYSAATNPNKYIRVGSTGTFEIINSAYTTNLFNLTDDGALSLPGPISISGKKAVNGPAFSAYAEATLQTITSGSQQKVLFQTEEFDTDGCYANSRFTPTVEGYYQLNAEVRLDGSSGTGEIMIVLYKNTSEHKRGTNQSGSSIGTNFFAMQVSALVYANGTTDYFEIKVQQTSGGSMTVTAVNNPAITWFNGCMLRGA